MLDVLLGMAVFALVAVISVQGLMKYRERAYATQAISDARGLSQMTLAYLTTPGVEPPMNRLFDLGTTDPTVWMAQSAITEAELGMINANITSGTAAYWWPAPGSTRSEGKFIITSCTRVKAAQFNSATGDVKEQNGGCASLGLPDPPP